MKFLRLSIFLVLLLATVIATPTQAQAQVRGWGGAAGLFDGDFGVQVRKDFWLGGDISQFTAQASIFFPKTTVFRLDADYHFMIKSADASRFYPLAGIDFAFTSDHAKFGLNLGGGVNFRLTEHTNAFAELKYTISDWDGFGIMAGVYF